MYDQQMKARIVHLLRFIMLPILLSMSLLANASPIVFDGSIDENDFLGADFFGEFYYVFFDITSPTEDTVSLSIQLNDTLAFAYLWQTPVLAAPIWDDSDSSVGNLYASAISSDLDTQEITFDPFDIEPGETYQVAISTDYTTLFSEPAEILGLSTPSAETPALTFSASFDSENGGLQVTQAQVPEPFIFTLLGLGLAGLVSQRKNISL